MEYIKQQEATIRFYEGDKLIAEHLVGDWEVNQPIPEPRNANYYKTHCGPWIATMQVSGHNGDYIFRVDGNFVSMLKADCVYKCFAKEAKWVRGKWGNELSVFKAHRKWLMDEYGITCAKFV